MSYYSEACIAYASALDEVESCIERGVAPKISAKNIATIRTLKKNPWGGDEERLSDKKRASGLQNFLAYIILIIACFGLFPFAPLGWQIAIVLFPFVVLGFVVVPHLLFFVIWRVGGGSKVQSTEAAKIVNQLLKKHL